jgi:hypothetical protein
LHRRNFFRTATVSMCRSTRDSRCTVVAFSVARQHGLRRGFFREAHRRLEIQHFASQLPLVTSTIISEKRHYEPHARELVCNESIGILSATVVIEGLYLRRRSRDLFVNRTDSRAKRNRPIQNFAQRGRPERSRNDLVPVRDRESMGLRAELIERKVTGRAASRQCFAVIHR